MAVLCCAVKHPVDKSKLSATGLPPIHGAAHLQLAPPLKFSWQDVDQASVSAL